MKIEEIIQERIKENEKLFTKEELKILNENYNFINKVYMLGMIDNINVNSIKF